MDTAPNIQIIKDITQGTFIWEDHDFSQIVTSLTYAIKFDTDEIEALTEFLEKIRDMDSSRNTFLTKLIREVVIFQHYGKNNGISYLMNESLSQFDPSDFTPQLLNLIKKSGIIYSKALSDWEDEQKDGSFVKLIKAQKDFNIINFKNDGVDPAKMENGPRLDRTIGNISNNILKSYKKMAFLHFENDKTIMIQYDSVTDSYKGSYVNIPTDKISEETSGNHIFDNQEHLIYEDSVEGLFLPTNPFRNIMYKAYDTNLRVVILIPQAR